MKIILVGNPNVGKSVIFNHLTGSYITVSNYPGTTVEIAEGTGRFGSKKFSIIDTPGINTLVGPMLSSEDEKVTREVLSQGDIDCILQVADSKNLKRTLSLTAELAQLGLPMILVLNMSDEAKERGIHINTRRLSEILGTDVLETVAVTGEGIAKLKEAITMPKRPKQIAPLPNQNMETSKSATGIILQISRAVEEVLKEVLTISSPMRKRHSETISHLTMRPVTGIPVLILVLVAMYLVVGRFTAGIIVNFLQARLFGDVINPFFEKTISEFIHISLIKDFFVGNYGILTMALPYAVAIILPIVGVFFLFFGLLEDSGYLPRLSVLSDKVFRLIGLNGRAILPLVLGLGCGTMATLTARILDTKKERMLVTLLLMLAIPCSAQLGVIMGLLSGISLKATVIWFGVVSLAATATAIAASKIISGERTPFIQEIPPIRIPQITNILAKTFARLKWYIKEAVPLFVVGTVALFILDKTGALKLIEDVLSPIVVNLLGLPNKAAGIFILGFLRRDYGAAGLYALSKAGMFSNPQILVSIVVITLFIPCIAQFFVVVKDRGIGAAIFMGAVVFTIAFLVGGVLNLALGYFSVSL